MKTKPRKKDTTDDILGVKTVGQLRVESLADLSAEIKSDKKKVLSKLSVRRLRIRTDASTYTPKKVKETRDLLRLSQAMFAQFIGVSPGTVRAWEQGGKIPRDSAGRMMDEIRHNPEYFQLRLLAMLENKPEKKRATPPAKRLRKAAAT